MPTANTGTNTLMQLDRIEKFIELVFEDELEHVIASGRVKPELRQAPDEIKRSVVAMHSDLLRALDKRAHQLWNIEEGLY